MIVEDEPLVAFDNEHLLKEAGYDVVATVDNVAAARAVIDGEALDLVLTDMSLRGDGDGADVARAAAGRGVPVLFVTATCPVDAPAMSLGCLAKPYSDKVLRAALDAVDDRLQGRRSKKLPPQLVLYESV